MKHSQDNTQPKPALLRNTNGIATPVNNSCCAAASIIASSRITAEGLIPHEKLREAATPNATLIAQNRPPAQPALGYTPPSSVVDALPESRVDRKSWAADLTSSRPDREELIGQLAEEIGSLGICSAAERELFERVIDKQVKP